MNKIINFFCQSYIRKDFYTKKKAGYAAVFMLLILTAMLLILGVELFSFGFSRMKIGITAGFVAGFILLLSLLRYGRLEISLNLLLTAGLLRSVMIMDYILAVQFYSNLFLVLLSMAVIHVKRYQLYCAYSGTWLLMFVRLMLYRESLLPHPMKGGAFHQGLYSLILASVFIVMIHIVVKVIEREIQESSKLAALSETDTLTGVGNRRKLQKTLDGLNLNGETSFSILLLDLDHFKRVNDTYGHDTGDRILREMVHTIQKDIREEDSLYRWGGEEFLLLLPSLAGEDLFPAAERIRRNVEDRSFADGLKVTISIGGAEGGSTRELSEMIKQADTALYRAKETGRNRVCLHETSQ